VGTGFPVHSMLNLLNLDQAAWVKTHAACIAFRRHAGFHAPWGAAAIGRFEAAMRFTRRSFV
jgi:hypothetical protein